METNDGKLVVIVWGDNKPPSESMVRRKAQQGDIHKDVYYLHCNDYYKTVLKLRQLEDSGFVAAVFCTPATPHTLAINYNMVKL